MNHYPVPSRSGNRQGPYSTFGNAVDIHNADRHHFVINDYLHRHTAVDTVLIAQANPGDTQITVNDITGFLITDLLHFGVLGASNEPVHPSITVTPAGSTLILDRPLDNVHLVGTLITQSIADMSSAAGTLNAPVSYKYFPVANRLEHIKRIIISMTHSTAGADDLFGGIAALTNGVVFRAKINGVINTFTNWKTNGDIVLDVGANKLIYSAKSGPGDFGTTAEGAFSDLDVVIPLNDANGDFLEILIQDISILTLTDFRIKAQGHVEGL